MKIRHSKAMWEIPVDTNEFRMVNKPMFILNLLNQIFAALAAQEAKKEAHANNVRGGLHSGYEQATWRSGVE